MFRVLVLAILSSVAVACSAAPEPTSQVIYVTPEPATATATATGTPAGIPTPTIVAPTPTGMPPTPAVTSAPSIVAPATPLTVSDHISLAGSLGLTVDQFTEGWNQSLDDDDLAIRRRDWQIGENANGVTTAQHYWTGDNDNFGIVAVLNDDESIRSATVIYVPGTTDDLSAALDELTAIFAHQALIDAVIPDLPQEQRYAVLGRVAPAPEDDYTGVEASTSEAGVNFRLTDQGDQGVLFIARQDNLGFAVGPDATAPAVRSMTSSRTKR